MQSNRIAVVTPYCRESAGLLKRCHDSAMRQGVNVTHFFVADGQPNAEIADWPCRHVALGTAHADFGDTPRALGAMLADREGFDFVAFLDADNFYLEGHLSSLLELHRQTQASVLCAWRSYFTPDGTPLPVEEVDEMACGHVDTSCYMFHRAAFAVFPAWINMPAPLHAVGDRVVFRWLRQHRFSLAFLKRKTVGYTTHYKIHYQVAGVPVPDDARDQVDYKAAWEYLKTAAGVIESVNRIGFWPM